MRSTLSILLLLAFSLEADVRFTEPRAFPDLGLEMPLLADATPEAVEMPKTDSFLVTDTDGTRRLEDRFDTFDLWSARTIRGRWRDADGNLFTIARLAFEPPDDAPGTLMTRTDFEARLLRHAIAPRDAAARNTAVVAAAPVDVSEEPVKPRRGHRRNLEELLYFPGTNAAAAVWAFRPAARERGQTPNWYMASLVCAPNENVDAAAARFDEDFLDRIRLLPPTPAPRAARTRKPSDPAEGELLARDYSASTVNYARWHFAENGNVLVTDDLASEWRGAFVGGLTNDLPRLRRAYAAVAPSPLLDVTNAPAAVRVFADRADYLAYVGEAMEWTAAVWSPLHRELVLYLPLAGSGELLKTVRHEAFHQYLAYAGALAEAAPWFNEGHAELFHYTSFDHDGNVVYDEDPVAAPFIRQHAEEISKRLASFLAQDYPAFYADDAALRQANYRIAWSIAYFLQTGASKVRFQPFATLRSDYVATLVETRDGAAATRAVFTADRLRLFAAEWKKFWTR